MRASVDFPEPFAPTTPTSSPGPTETVTPFSAGRVDARVARESTSEISIIRRFSHTARTDRPKQRGPRCERGPLEVVACGRLVDQFDDDHRCRVALARDRAS